MFSLAKLIKPALGLLAGVILMTAATSLAAADDTRVFWSASYDDKVLGGSQQRPARARQSGQNVLRRFHLLPGGGSRRR